MVELDKETVAVWADVSAHKSKISVAVIPVGGRKEVVEACALDFPSIVLKPTDDKLEKIVKSVDVGNK